MSDIYKVTGAGLGFDGLVVGSSGETLGGLKNNGEYAYKAVTKVFDTYSTGEVPPEMPIPDGVVLFREDVLESVKFADVQPPDDISQEVADEVDETYGDVCGVKTCVFNDIEVYVVFYTKGVFCSVLHAPSGISGDRVPVGDKFFPVIESATNEEDIAGNAHAQVVSTVFGNVLNYEDLCKWCASFVVDLEKLQSISDANIQVAQLQTDIFENSWEVSGEEDVNGEEG